MATLREHLRGDLPAGQRWAAEAAARLSADIPLHQPVRAVTQGWMQLGAGTLVDTLFVLTEDRLGFGQTAVRTSDPVSLPLHSIRAIDLIEGLPHPLNPVEVQLTNGLAMFVGWPDAFLHDVIDQLRRLLEAQPSTPVVGPAVEESTTRPTPASQPASPVTGAAANPLMAPLFADTARTHLAKAADLSPSATPEAGPSVTPEPRECVTFPDATGSGQRDAAADRFFADLEPQEADQVPPTQEREPSGEPAPPSTIPGTGHPPWEDPAMVWPAPLENVVYLGGHPRHPRRRKRTTLMLGRHGVVGVAEGVVKWSVHLRWTEVTRIDVQGADEIKFTHNQRIDLNAAAIVIEVEDGTAYVFECRSRRPASLRASLAPVINMVASARRPGRGFVAI